MNASDTRATLHCWATGNGCLGFSWLDGRGTALGRPVTKAHALNYLRRNDSLHLQRFGFRVYRIDHNWVLARKIVVLPSRIAANTLRFVIPPDATREGAETYRFTFLDPEKTPYVDSQLILQFQYTTPNLTHPRSDNQVSIEEEWFDVKNLSVRLAVLCYFNHREQFDPQEGEF